MSTLSSSAIMISALEEQGLVDHVDLDTFQLEEFFEAPNKPNIIRFKKNRGLLQSKFGTGLQREAAETTRGLLAHRVYFSSCNNEPLVDEVVKAANMHTFQAIKVKSDIVKAMESVKVSSQYETEVILLLRFIERKNDFFENNAMLTGEKLANLLELHDKNIGRAVGKLVKANKVIALKKGESRIYPAFQFNSKGKVYPALQEILPIVAEHEISPLDLCFWLTEYCSATLHVPENVETYLNDSFEDMMKKATSLSVKSKVYRGKPIDTLVTDDTETFKQLFNLWLSPETYDLNVADGNND